MQPLKQLQNTMLETITTLVSDMQKQKVTGKDLKELFNSQVFVDKRNPDIKISVKDFLKEKNIVLDQKTLLSIAYLHQLYSDPNSSDLGKVGDEKIGEFRSFMKGSFAAARKVAKLAQPALNMPAAAPAPVEAPAKAPAAVDKQEIQQKFEPQKRHPQFEAWSLMLKNDVVDDTLNWLALHAGAPVDKQTSRNEKVQQIMERLQERREVDLLPSLLANLGAANVAFQMGNYQTDLRNSRIVLMYKMFSNISHDQMDRFNMITGAPRNPSVPAIQQFAKIFSQYSADQLYQLMSDPLVSMANVREYIHPIFNAGALSSAALRSESRVPSQPAVSQPAYKQAAPVPTAVSQPVYKQAAPAPQPTAITPQPQASTEQSAGWAVELQTKASDDTLEWLALHTDAPVDRTTSRAGKVTQIIFTLQSRNELDLIPSLYPALGGRKVAGQLGNAPLRDVSNHRTVLLYNIFKRIGPDAIENLYRLVGMPINTSDMPPKLFSNLVEFNTAETLKELFIDVGLADLQRDVDALYGSGIPSAALGTGNRAAPSPAAANVPAPEVSATKGRYAPTAPNIAPVQQPPQPPVERDRVEKAYYDVYLKNGDFSHMPFVTLQFAISDHMDPEIVKRLVKHYEAPVKIKTGSDLVEWLKGRWDPTTNQAMLTNKPETIEKFLETYRKYRQAASETIQASEGTFGGADLVEKAYQTYTNSKRDHGAYVAFKFALDSQMSADTVQRLVQYYKAPVRIQTGIDLLTWLEGVPNAARTGGRLSNNEASVKQFMEEYRKNR